MVWSRQRRARSGAVARPFAPLSSLCHPPPSLPQPAVPRPSPEETPVASASPILNGMSRPRGAVLRAAPAGCASGGHRRALGACDRGGGAKMPFILPIRSMTSVAMGTSNSSAIGLSSLTSLPLRGDGADDTVIAVPHRVKPRKLGALWSVAGWVFYGNRRARFVRSRVWTVHRFKIILQLRLFKERTKRAFEYC